MNRLLIYIGRDKRLFLLGMFSSLLVGMGIGHTVMAQVANQGKLQYWKGDTITILDRSGWGHDVQVAMQQWNNAGLGIQFKMVYQLPADVVILSKPGSCSNCAAFTSYRGSQPGGSQDQIVLQQYPSHLERRHPTYYWSRVLVHEMGHVLGLPHTDKCSVMARVFAKACGLDYEPSVRICGPMRYDIQQAAKLYGYDHARRRQSTGCRS